MTTHDVIRGFFDSLRRRQGWEAFLADDMTFSSYTHPVKEVRGRDACLTPLRRFYSSIASLELRDLIVDGDKACALMRYTIQPPGRDAFSSDVAEIFTVANGKIVTFGIYFDTAPYPR